MLTAPDIFCKYIPEYRLVPTAINLIVLITGVADVTVNPPVMCVSSIPSILQSTAIAPVNPLAGLFLSTPEALPLPLSLKYIDLHANVQEKQYHKIFYVIEINHL